MVKKKHSRLKVIIFHILKNLNLYSSHIIYISVPRDFKADVCNIWRGSMLDSNCRYTFMCLDAFGMQQNV